ncbi:MAG: RNA-binding S4 domain-containing protein [Acholeplasmatales bacterium]|jgi:ribosome-associated protein YbcJ (S4-like RNA binding protein)|nr:RNA-binding S4 domain-containing protein [Acholeplasmatales bacterium]
MKFKLNAEYITLGSLLKATAIIETGGYAKQFIIKNSILVNDIICKERGRKIYPGFIVKVDKKIIEIE